MQPVMLPSTEQLNQTINTLESATEQQKNVLKLWASRVGDMSYNSSLSVWDELAIFSRRMETLSDIDTLPLLYREIVANFVTSFSDNTFSAWNNSVAYAMSTQHFDMYYNEKYTVQASRIQASFNDAKAIMRQIFDAFMRVQTHLLIVEGLAREGLNNDTDINSDNQYQPAITNYAWQTTSFHHTTKNLLGNISSHVLTHVAFRKYPRCEQLVQAWNFILEFNKLICAQFDELDKAETLQHYCDLKACLKNGLQYLSYLIDMDEYV